jgi:hypothetical protein
MSNGLPESDSDRHDFQEHYIGKIAADPKVYGHTQEDVDRLLAAQATWVLAYATHKKVQIEAVERSQAKNVARDGLSAELRSSIRKVNALPTVNNALRAALDIPAHAEGRSAVSAPTTRPIGRIVDKGGLRQELHWVDETTPHLRKKPDGVHGCQLWLKIGDTPPVDDTDCRLASTDTATPYLYEFEPEDAGKTAYWLLRWVSTRGEVGPFGLLLTWKINS